MNIKLQQGKVYQTTDGDLCTYLYDSPDLEGISHFILIKSGVKINTLKSEIRSVDPSTLGSIEINLEDKTWYLIRRNTGVFVTRPVYWEGGKFWECEEDREGGGAGKLNFTPQDVEIVCKLGKS